MTFETYKLPQGKIVIAHSDKNLSVGYLVLNSHTELEKHSRPVKEQLSQIKGLCALKLFEKNSTKEIILKEGDFLDVQPNQQHIHVNKNSEESITLWKFNGDIVEIINEIRNNNERIE